MKKLTPEEKQARKEAREKARSDKHLKDIYKSSSDFYSIFELPEYEPLRMAEKRAWELYMKHLASGVKDKNFVALRTTNIATEEFRCKVVVDRFSSTHNWEPYDGGLFLKCKDCGYKASKHAWREGDRYDEDVVKYPHYDMENHLIKYTCAELQERYNERKEKNYRRCRQCGVWGCPHWWEPDGSRGNYKI